MATQARPAARGLRWPPQDPILLLLTVLLPLGGAVMVASARIPAVLGEGAPLDADTIQQMIFGITGLVLALGLSAVDYQRYERVALPALGIAWLLLLGVYFFSNAPPQLAARRWFVIGDFTLQPSEFAKLALILALAKLAKLFGARVRDWRIGLLGGGGLLAAVVLPVIAEPDLGTAVTMSAVGLAMLFVAGVRLRHLAVLPIGAALAGAVSIAVHEYQRARVLAFLTRDPEVTNTGYQAAQAKIALGAGGVTGRGLGAGTQKFLLPVPDSDSIFAVIGEEFGLVGTGLVLVLFLALFVRGIQIAGSTEDPFGRLLAVGIVTQLTFQAFVNMGVVTGLIPVTGLTLPFVSLGGSSLLASLLMMGILLNVARKSALQRRE
ncbi:MAG: putative peptidoglycan glycosyltransferase FtsW [Chloroflexi bacterium]|nr:putative peptidoglycan glycosyltransferase FtsW [Chloroflexota bacterium]